MQNLPDHERETVSPGPLYTSVLFICMFSLPRQLTQQLAQLESKKVIDTYNNNTLLVSSIVHVHVVSMYMYITLY